MQTAKVVSKKLRQVISIPDKLRQVNVLHKNIENLYTELNGLQEQVHRLEADLDQSRRLNLRAAKLLDVVYEKLE